MSEEFNFQFRNALHGYNREDVVNFIDRMTREHEEALAQLQEQNTQLRQQLDETAEALANAVDNERAAEDLELAKAQISDLLTKNEALEDRIRELETAQPEPQAQKAREPELPSVDSTTQEQDEPIPPVAEVLPVNVAPSKDYTELELAAYRRAELAERLARERAADVYRQVQSVFQQANTKLDTSRADLAQLSGVLRSDINQFLTLLANINTAYNDAELSFAQVKEKNRQVLEED